MTSLDENADEPLYRRPQGRWAAAGLPKERALSASPPVIRHFRDHRRRVETAIARSPQHREKSLILR
jgi:hypothetical protein